jgi:uncharacterized membrane protein
MLILKLEYSLYISTIAATLLNFGNKTRPGTLVVPALYTAVAILCLVYSVVIYLYRSQAIRERRAARYYDKWGPSVLCVALLGAIVVNFAYELRDRSII